MRIGRDFVARLPGWVIAALDYLAGKKLGAGAPLSFVGCTGPEPAGLVGVSVSDLGASSRVVGAWAAFSVPACRFASCSPSSSEEGCCSQPAAKSPKTAAKAKKAIR